MSGTRAIGATHARAAGDVGKTARKVAVPAAGALVLSHLLQMLSGSALWVPSSLRIAVELFTTLLGTTVFFLVDERARRTTVRRNGRLAIAWTLAAIAGFVAYLVLRGQCLIAWDPADWRADKEPADFAALPEAVDAERGRVYVPLWFTPEQRAYIAALERAPDTHDGMQWILQYEPDRLFDWLRRELTLQASATSALFLAVHLAIVGCVAAAAARARARLGP